MNTQLVKGAAPDGRIAGQVLRRLELLPRFEEMLKRDEIARVEQLRRQYEHPDYWLNLALGKAERWQQDAQSGIVMAATPATANFQQMANVVGNTGGAIQTLGQVNLSGGRQRTWIDKLVLNSQVSGTVFGVARLPLFATLLAIELLTDTSLGTSTIKFGDAGNANSAIFAAAQTLTSTNTVVRTATAGTKGAPITSGFDSVTGNLVTAGMPQTAGEGGFGYEDIIMTTGVATLPASGNLIVMIEYLGPDS